VLAFSRSASRSPCKSFCMASSTSTFCCIRSSSEATRTRTPAEFASSCACVGTEATSAFCSKASWT